MNYKWRNTGIGKVDNLGRQLEKTFKGARQGSIETRWRYAEAGERFIRHVGENFGLQKIQNISDKHLESYALELKERGCADKYIKNELAAIRYIHNQIPQARYGLADSKAFNKSIGLQSTPDGRADRAWTEEEFKEMRQVAIANARRDIVKTMDAIRHTGMRLDEACTLKRNEVENALRTGILHLENTKGGRPRDIELTEEARNVLEVVIKDVPRAGYVFTPQKYWDKGIHRFEASVQRFMCNHRHEVQEPDRNQSAHNVDPEEKAPLTVHGLRHMYAREEFERKIEEGKTEHQARQELAVVLGHGRESVTHIYLSK